MTLEKENCKNRIHLDNAIMTNKRKIAGSQNLRNNLTIWSGNDTFDILNDISENVTLVQLMDSLGNVNHAIIIVGHWRNRWRSILYLHIDIWLLYNEKLHIIFHYNCYHQYYSSSLLPLAFLSNSFFSRRSISSQI